MAGRSNDVTEDLPPNEPLATLEGRPAFVVAFPRSLALDLPLLGEPVGRDWFLNQGAPDPTISARHFAVHRHGAGFALEDVGSTHGTYLEGQALRPHERVPLRDGAVIRLGRTLLVFREALIGSKQPSEPLGRLHAPFGLRGVERRLRRVDSEVRSVLLRGPSGSGKELLAEHLAARLRPKRPYDQVNVTAVPGNVFEAQLFGYVPGAFSGALAKGSLGLLRSAHGGCVLLDELGELPLELQPKLLRFLDDHRVQPVGGSDEVKVDVLVLAATNVDLEAAVEQRTFRLDLLARLQVTLELPALDERPEDLFAIMNALMKVAYDPAKVEVAAMERLALHVWPHNVRGLHQTLLEVAALVDPPKLTRAAVDAVLGEAPRRVARALHDADIERALATHGGNKSKAAESLGISRAALLRLLAKRKKSG